MTSDLVKRKKKNVTDVLNQIDNSIIPDSSFNRIVSRALDNEDGSLINFNTFDENKITRIAENMPEINRATRSLGRRNTQSTNRLMSLTMFSGNSPYRVIRQCLSQIENKRIAIKENRYRIMKERLKVEEIQKNLERNEKRLNRTKIILEEENLPSEEIEKYEEKIEDIKIENLRMRIDIEEKLSSLADSMLYIEGALKEIASFQSSYQQICRNKNIPEDWDEEDMEKAEIEFHLRLSFLHAYRDVMSRGNLGIGTLEYLQQLGVHPSQALLDTRNFLRTLDNKIIKRDINPITGKTDNERIDDNVELDYEDDLEKWLDEMVEKNKYNYKKVLKRIGLDNLYEDWYMYKEKLREE